MHTSLRLFVVSCDKLCYSEHFSCTYSLRGKWKKLQLGGLKTSGRYSLKEPLEVGNMLQLNWASRGFEMCDMSLLNGIDMKSMAFYTKSK